MDAILKISFVVIVGFIVWAAGHTAYARYRIDNFKDNNDLQLQVDSICNQYIADKKAVGLCVGVVQGNKVYIKGYGLLDKDGKAVPDGTTVFEIGSISKVFTAEMAQLLVDKGVLKWSDNIAAYLPAEVHMPVDDNTTLMHLATHTAGFPRVPLRWFASMTNSCDPYSSLTITNLYDYLNNATDKKKPDTAKTDYSNLGMGLLGHILEWKTKKDYETLLQELISTPLGLKHTSLLVKDETKFASGHSEKGEKTCHWQLPIIQGAGAIRSNMNDMVRFLQANMNDENSIGASFNKTHQQQVRSRMGGTGLGWHIDRMNGTKEGIPEIVWHNGGTGGFRSYMAFSAKDNRGVIVLSNQVHPGFDRLGIDLAIMAIKTSLQ